MPPEVAEMINHELAALPPSEARGLDWKKPKIFAGKGCRACGNAGYVGRVGIFEVMPISDKIKTLILNRQSPAELYKQARAEGMIVMKQDGLIKVLKGVTTIEEVIRVTKE